MDVYSSIGPLEASWRALEASGCCTLFQSYDWLSVWYDVAARHGHAEPVIAAASRQGCPGVQLILPLCRIRRGGYWEIGFPDVVTDFAGPVFAPAALDITGTMHAVWGQVLATLPACDVVRLRMVSEHVGGRRNPLMELPGISPFPCGLWGVPLADVPPGDLPRGIDRNVAKKTCRRRRQLEQSCLREFEWRQAPAQLSDLFEALLRIRLQRSQSLQRSEVLIEAIWLDFYRQMVARRHSDIEAVIARITADRETIAATLGFIYRGVFHDIVPAIDGESWRRYAPGIQLILDAMREAAGRGISYYDLTIGDEPYKRSLGAERRPLFQIFVPRSPLGWVLFALWRAKRLLGRGAGGPAGLAT